MTAKPSLPIQMGCEALDNGQELAEEMQRPTQGHLVYRSACLWALPCPHHAAFELLEVVTDVLPMPDFILIGTQGLIHAALLSNRVHASGLTVHTVSTVAVCDIVPGACIGQFLQFSQHIVTMIAITMRGGASLTYTRHSTLCASALTARLSSCCDPLLILA
jgi:hypothetical protein